MLKIGNFSRITSVSIRLLHYYAEIDLFHPAHIDTDTGYRYYKMEQIQDLNRILALRDLGLSLDEIKQYVKAKLSADELRGMLLLKKSQLKQSLREELLKLQRVEYRLGLLENDQESRVQDVIIKPVPAQHYISMRNPKLPANQFHSFISTVFDGLHRQAIKPPGTLTILEHSETLADDFFDLEIGFCVPENEQLPARAIMVNEQQTLAARTLPAAKQMATLLHIGPWGTGINSYFALGMWIEAHGFELVGAIREVYMDVKLPDGGDNIVEFQLPIQAIERTIVL